MSRAEIRARQCELAGLYVENLALRLAQVVVTWGMAARRRGESRYRNALAERPQTGSLVATLERCSKHFSRTLSHPSSPKGGFSFASHLRKSAHIRANEKN